MSSNVFALDWDPTRRTLAPPKKRARITSAPWSAISLASASALRAPADTRWPGYTVWLVLAALLTHGALIGFADRFDTGETLPAKARQVAVELVRPPKPVEPKIEPPKPVKATPRQPAKVLPPIATATPEPSAVESVSTAEPVAVAPVVSEPVAPAEEPVTAPTGHAGYLNNPPPEYPAVAVRQRWEGMVLLRVHVLSDGRVQSVEVQQSSGRRVLDDQAVRTVNEWLFAPAKRGATAIDGWATVPIEFRLDS